MYVLDIRSLVLCVSFVNTLPLAGISERLLVPGLRLVTRANGKPQRHFVFLHFCQCTVAFGKTWPVLEVALQWSLILMQEFERQ